MSTETKPLAHLTAEDTKSKDTKEGKEGGNK
jgi:hypothetical protein